jgi:hypothetical protein
MKLSVLIGNTPATGGGRASVPSITLAGDTSQRLFLDNGFGDWRGVLAHLDLGHVAVEPLRIAYRSTREIWRSRATPPSPRFGRPRRDHHFPSRRRRRLPPTRSAHLPREPPPSPPRPPPAGRRYYQASAGRDPGLAASAPSSSPSAPASR